MIYTESLQKCIFKIPTKHVGYDYTFAIGSAIYDKIDYNTISSQDLLNKENMHDNNNDYSDDDDEEKKDNDFNFKPSNKIRKKSSKLDTSWLITTNDKEFILSITITPGLVFISFYIYFVIILYLF